MIEGTLEEKAVDVLLDMIKAWLCCLDPLFFALSGFVREASLGYFSLCI